MATCNRVECFSHPDAQIALTLIRKDLHRYAVINHVTGFFWIPNNPDTDLLQFDMAAQHTVIG